MTRRTVSSSPARDGLLFQPLLELARRLGELEGGGDLGALRAVAHHFRAGAAAGQQLQRIDQDGLAGAGFAGEHREPGTQLQLHVVDDGEVADLQMGQHRSQRSELPRPQWSLERSRRK